MPFQFLAWDFRYDELRHMQFGCMAAGAWVLFLIVVVIWYESLDVERRAGEVERLALQAEIAALRSAAKVR